MAQDRVTSGRRADPWIRTLFPFGFLPVGFPHYQPYLSYGLAFGPQLLPGDPASQSGRESSFPLYTSYPVVV